MLRTTLVRGDYEVGITNQAPGWPFEPDPWLRTHYHSDGTLNFPKWSDPVLD